MADFFIASKDAGTKLFKAGLTAAEWRLWYYFSLLDPFGDKYRRGTHAGLRTDLLVEGQQVVAHPGGDVPALSPQPVGLGLQLPERGRAGLLGVGEDGVERLALLGEHPHPVLGALGTLHDLELDLLQLGLTATQGVELVLQGLQLLRRPLTGVGSSHLVRCEPPARVRGRPDLPRRLGSRPVPFPTRTCGVV